jgi:hypothetical protein
MIENGVKLDLLIISVADMKAKQDANHVVTMALAEHQTIARVDALWTDLGQIKWLLRLAVTGVLGIPSLAAVSHVLFRWP